MKALLEFTLPEEDYDFRTAQDAMAYRRALRDLDEYLRSKIKYGNEYQEAMIILQDIRTKLHELAPEGFEE